MPYSGYVNLFDGSVIGNCFRMIEMKCVHRVSIDIVAVEALKARLSKSLSDATRTTKEIDRFQSSSCRNHCGKSPL
jgi:hypothetical protein